MILLFAHWIQLVVMAMAQIYEKFKKLNISIVDHDRSPLFRSSCF